MSYIEFKNICKEYKMGEVKIKALENTNFSIEKGELVVIVGPSGAGKSIILSCLAREFKKENKKTIILDFDLLNNDLITIFGK